MNTPLKNINLRTVTNIVCNPIITTSVEGSPRKYENLHVMVPTFHLFRKTTWIESTVALTCHRTDISPRYDN